MDEEAPASVSFTDSSCSPMFEEEEEKKDGTLNEKQQEEEEPATLNDVYEALGSLSSPGSTCTGGVATELPPIPGLVVKGVGEISLPLQPESLTKLKQVAHQAPHGQGTKTIVDTSVRNTLQVNADQVRLTNPAWPAALASLTRKVAIALGVNADLVRPELYKLLLYEPGGFFKKHRDTEKAEGMFATLVIQLPSRFTGGSFRVLHNGKKETFEMEAPETAPYSCHYVGHYADCEHEILPVESGYRLALIYSLCYTGSEVSKPSVADIEEGTLARVLKRLPHSDSLFAVPFCHQYTSSSLARFGVGALKGDDRALAQTISRVDGWDMVLATAMKTDFERGYCTSKYGDFEAHDSETREEEVQELFHQDGGDAGAHKKWLWSQLDFTSYEDGGKVLATEDECIDMWGDGDEGEVQHTGNEGSTRETTYTMCVLIAFSKEGVFERACQSCFSGAVAVLQRDRTLLDRMVRYIKTKKQVISSKNFVKLYHLVQGEHSFWKYFNVIFQALSKKEVPSSVAFSIMVTLIKEHGWNHDKVAPIRLLLEQLPKLAKSIDADEVMSLFDGLITIKNVLEDKSPLANLIQATMTSFEDGTEPASSSFSAPLFWHSRRTQFGIHEVCESLKALSSQFGWDDAGILARPLFVGIRKKNTNSRCLKSLANQLSDLSSIVSHVPITDVDILWKSVLEDFVLLVEAKPSSSPQNYIHNRQKPSSKGLWKSSEIDTVAKEFLMHGTPDLFQRIEAWASGESLANISDADSVLQKFKSSNIHSAHAAAKDKCIDHIHRRWREMKVDELKKEESHLLRKTQGGHPAFSWHMPNAKSGEPILDAFLRSGKKGPSEICVGGGINRARQLAGQGRYGSYGYSTTPKEILLKGYSAEVRNTNKTGQNASIVVTKTKQFYDAQINEYNTNIQSLAAVRAKLEKLGHRSSHPAPQPAAKRARPEQEVIEID